MGCGAEEVEYHAGFVEGSATRGMLMVAGLGGSDQRNMMVGGLDRLGLEEGQLPGYLHVKGT